MQQVYDVYKVLPEYGKIFARLVIGESSDSELDIFPITSLQAENAVDIEELRRVLTGTNNDFILPKLDEFFNRPEQPLIPRKRYRKSGKKIEPKETGITITINIK